MIATEDDPADPNSRHPERELKPCWRIIPVRAVRLPMPAPLFFDGQRLPASYANFYIANRIVLVPTFNDPNDRLALNILARSISRPRGHRHRLHGAGLGPGHAALHDATAAGWQTVKPPVPGSAVPGNTAGAIAGVTVVNRPLLY